MNRNRVNQNEMRSDDVKTPVWKSIVVFLRRHLFSLAIIIVFLWIILSVLASMSSWKAVFLDDKQVFFGKSINVPFTNFMTFRKVHYINTEGQVTPAAGISEKPDLVITPLSGMVHGPKDTMKINKAHILYYEELRTDTTLVKGLKESEGN